MMKATTKENATLILKEIESVISSIDSEQIEDFILKLINGRFKSKIVGVGAGRVGMALKGFIMRLGHMGYDAWFIGDTTVPSIGKEDILIVASGSGSTKTIVELVQIAYKNECMILCVTGNPDSPIGKLSDFIIEMKAPSATKDVNGTLSIQPMTTCNEQSLGILFDAIVLDLMKLLQETHETMWNNHSNLE